MGSSSSKEKPAPPPRVLTDEVVPLFLFDDQFIMKALLLDLTLRIDDVLDAQKLKQALQRLLELEGWRKLGARVRMNDQGKLEYHIPQSYDEQRPAFLFHHEQHDQSIDEHPIGCQMPRAKSEPVVFNNPMIFHEFSHPDHPLTIEGWLYSDKPAISLSVTSFNDATVLTLSWSHTLMDVMALESFLGAWVTVLKGREDKVAPFAGFKTDPIDNVVEKVAPQKYLNYDKQLSRNDNRIVQIPGSYVQELKHQARQDLNRDSPNDAPFLSDGDVLLAWWAKLTLSSLNLSPRRNVAICNVFNIRNILPELMPAGAACMGNQVWSINIFMTAAQLLRQSLGKTALSLREAILQQRTPEQIRALISFSKQNIEEKGHSPLCGPYDQMMLNWSNWSKARLFELDFSAAALRPGRPPHLRKNTLGTPSLVTHTGHQNGVVIRNGGSLTGIDAEGNYWISWGMRAAAWPEVERKIKAIADKK